MYFFFFQAEDGIRDLVRSRGLGDVYKRQAQRMAVVEMAGPGWGGGCGRDGRRRRARGTLSALSLIHI